VQRDAIEDLEPQTEQDTGDELAGPRRLRVLPLLRGICEILLSRELSEILPACCKLPIQFKTRKLTTGTSIILHKQVMKLSFRMSQLLFLQVVTYGCFSIFFSPHRGRLQDAVTAVRHYYRAQKICGNGGCAFSY